MVLSTFIGAAEKELVYPILPILAGERTEQSSQPREYEDIIQAALQWIQNTVSTCEAFATAANIPTGGASHHITAFL